MSEPNFRMPDVPPIIVSTIGRWVRTEQFLRDAGEIEKAQIVREQRLALEEHYGVQGEQP